MSDEADVAWKRMDVLAELGVDSPEYRAAFEEWMVAVRSSGESWKDWIDKH